MQKILKFLDFKIQAIGKIKKSLGLPFDLFYFGMRKKNFAQPKFFGVCNFADLQNCIAKNLLADFESAHRVGACGARSVNDGRKATVINRRTLLFDKEITER